MFGLGFGLLGLFAEGSSTEGVTPVVIASHRTRVPTACWINNTPIEALGFSLARATDWLSAAVTPRVTVQGSPGLSGGRYATLQESSSLTVSLVGRLRGVTIDTRATVANAFSDALRGLLEVRFPDASDKVLRGLAGPVSVSAPLQFGQFAEPEVEVRVDIVCADGARYARNATQLILGTTPLAIPLGSLASGGDIFIMGPLTGALDIDLITPNGVRAERHALRSIDIPSGGYARMRIDPPHALLVYDADGEATSVQEWRSLSLSSRWWQPSSSDANAARAQWPFIRLSTGTGVYRYHQAWEH